MAKSVLLARPLQTEGEISFAQCIRMSFDTLLNKFTGRITDANAHEMLIDDVLRKYLDVETIDPSDLNAICAAQPEIIVSSILSSVAPNWAMDCAYWQRLLDTGARIVLAPFGLRAWEDGNAYLSEGFVRILMQISERNSIGVVGEFTAESLARLGVKNICIIGSPALFYNGKLAPEIRSNPVDPVHPELHFHQHFRDIYQFPRDFWAHDIGFMHYFRGLFEKGCAFELTLATDFMRELTGYTDICGGYKMMNTCLQARGRFFLTAQAWRNAVQQNDFSLGSRVSAAVAALSVGTPSLLLTIDAASRELAQTHHLPSIPMTSFDSGRALAWYAGQCDISTFLHSYATGWNTLNDYVRQSGLTMR